MLNIVENIEEVNNHSSITYPVSVIKDANNVDEAKAFEISYLQMKHKKYLKSMDIKSVSIKKQGYKLWIFHRYGYRLKQHFLQPL